MLKVSDRAPDFTLPSVDGQAVTLSDGLISGTRVILVFLRHLG
ncbi:MAG: redoxin domain-containing protein [Chloroflexi bacterium]|nr:redoxin domain-containing protein [Chloroflexota bacterium]MBT7081034.1 redoxin domain-containing protein [Chloroflexota bacterium]MBT7289207.1 redoxin domain-containing protein [Chloroflexota bacterium]